MRETATQLATLQTLIDRSHQRTGRHLKSSTQPEKHAPSARQVVTDPTGQKVVAALLGHERNGSFFPH